MCLTNKDLLAEQVAVLVEELLGRAPAGDRRLVGVHDHDRQVGDRVEVVLVPVQVPIVTCSSKGPVGRAVWSRHAWTGSMSASIVNIADLQAWLHAQRQSQTDCTHCVGT